MTGVRGGGGDPTWTRVRDMSEQLAQQFVYSTAMVPASREKHRKVFHCEAVLLENAVLLAVGAAGPAGLGSAAVAAACAGALFKQEGTLCTP